MARTRHDTARIYVELPRMTDRIWYLGSAVVRQLVTYLETEARKEAECLISK